MPANAGRRNPERTLKSILSLAAALAVAASPLSAAPVTCADCVKSNLAYLAGDQLRGRACGTGDEHAAARFIAKRLSAYRVRGGGPGGAYLQPVTFHSPTYASAPTLAVGDVRFLMGRDILVLDGPPPASGTLQVVARGASVGEISGKVALVEAADPAVAEAAFKAGAAAVVMPPFGPLQKYWDRLALAPPGPVRIEGLPAPVAKPVTRTMIFARAESFEALRKLAGQEASFTATLGKPVVRKTYNVLGVIPGSAPEAEAQSILLSAHYDHLAPLGGVLYRGANDDASGTSAVLEFARQLGGGKTPRRTVRFTLFGCEEAGGHGAKYFLDHPPAPLNSIAANLEFEMIGVPDPERPSTLMLTGWERSNLGPALKAQGADLGVDRYPEQNFFQRSDNYQLAKRGVVAHTISAWPVPASYHQPSDTIANLDMPFMLRVIESLSGPIRWLVNSDFRPEWGPGMKP